MFFKLQNTVQNKEQCLAISTSWLSFDNEALLQVTEANMETFSKEEGQLAGMDKLLQKKLQRQFCPQHSSDLMVKQFTDGGNI